MFTMRKELYIDAVDKAEEIIDKLGSNTTVIDTAKVINLVENITGYSIELYRADFSIVDMEKVGAFTDVSTSTKDGREVKVAEIFINSLKSWPQQRFSLVHELGHLMLGDINGLGTEAFAHHDAEKSLLDDEEIGEDITKINEQKANIFALLVLMPQETLKRKIRTNGTLELSNDFIVTEKAVLDRLKVYFNTDMAV